ncbi:K(+)-transporting ATPase subunit F [Burkholderia sp. AU31624]|uniref:K(+)-transporting ATPase subunit F n=1 Tax=unclassified Burkholderia TaxID=2613784 RepID=UPI001CF2D24F|nr:MULTISPECIES: K(+)-transporting ATPase subunit F [unclassified Burkholderia]MCA8063950.1 K(+)-transporting ATPase subunit F [Burkholderia sp. AU38729]MCA8253180.1 K(+)-transporting ATPase subunit F [Burkholderia sp. AU31624]
MYRLVLALKRTHKNAIAAGFRLYSFFTLRKEIEHRFDTRISTLSHPIRQLSMGASYGPAPQRQGSMRRRSRGIAAHRKKGKAMLWITGALSLALFIYLFHALIQPERY